MELTKNQKIQALVDEGGYTKKEAYWELVDMGEIEDDGRYEPK